MVVGGGGGSRGSSGSSGFSGGSGGNGGAGGWWWVVVGGGGWWWVVVAVVVRGTLRANSFVVRATLRAKSACQMPQTHILILLDEPSRRIHRPYRAKTVPKRKCHTVIHLRARRCSETFIS